MQPLLLWLSENRWIGQAKIQGGRNSSSPGPVGRAALGTAYLQASGESVDVRFFSLRYLALNQSLIA